MNSIQRFFRKYFLSTMGLLLLFLSINILLALTVLIIYYKSSSAPELPVARLAEGITERNGIICSDPQVKKILTENRCWAMLLDDSGTVVWEEGMPKSLPEAIPPQRLPNSADGIYRNILYMYGNILWGYL